MLRALHHRPAAWLAIHVGACLGAASVPSGAVEPSPGSAVAEFARQPSWPLPRGVDVRRAALDWLATVDADAPAGERAREVWDGVARPAAGLDVPDAVMETIVIAEPRAAMVRESVAIGATPPADWLDEPTTAAFVRDGVKLWLGRELVRRDRFDEALPILASLDVAVSHDPATLLFHRAACQHWLLDAAGAAESLDALLERESDIPVRYARVARLLRADVDRIRADSLDHIARRMRDLSRRLDQGRPGPATQRVQEGVVKSLDDLIAELQRQQDARQQAGGAAGSGSGSQGRQFGAGRPPDDSRPLGGRGAGDVESRPVGAESGWGNLPAHERERVLQQIGREYPAHYREAIEQYFKRLAAGGEVR